MSENKTIVIPEDKIADQFRQACQILNKVRFYRRRFEKDHDATTKKQMKSWEARADEFLMSLQLEDEKEIDNEQPEMIKE